MERLEQFERKWVHVLPTTHKGNSRHKVTLPSFGAELYRKGVKKYLKTLERLEEFEPNHVHILPTTHKGKCRLNVALTSLGVEL